MIAQCDHSIVLYKQVNPNIEINVPIFLEMITFVTKHARRLNLMDEHNVTSIFTSPHFTLLQILDFVTNMQKVLPPI